MRKFWVWSGAAAVALAIVGYGPTDAEMAAKQLEAKVSPYEKERVPIWERVAALLALLAIAGGIGFMGVRYVLLSDVPEQRPPEHRIFK